MLDESQLGDASPNWTSAVFLAGHILSDAELLEAALSDLADSALTENGSVPLLSSALSYLGDKPQQQLEYLRAGIKQSVRGCEPSEVLLVVLLLRLDQLGENVAESGETQGPGKRRRQAAPTTGAAVAAKAAAEEHRLDEQQVAALLQQVAWGTLQPAEMKALGSLVNSCDRKTAGLQLVKECLLQRFTEVTCVDKVPALHKLKQQKRAGKKSAKYLAVWYPTDHDQPEAEGPFGCRVGRIKSFGLTVELKVFVEDEGEQGGVLSEGIIVIHTACFFISQYAF